MLYYFLNYYFKILQQNFYPKKIYTKIKLLKVETELKQDNDIICQTILQ